MELTQVKSILHQTNVGELLTDGMGCSEPILSIKGEKVIDNFFVYLANKKVCNISGPIARIGLDAEDGVIDYLISCEDRPLSLGPKDVTSIEYPTIQKDDYENYGHSYAKLRSIAFKANCTAKEKKIISDYLIAFKQVVAPQMIKLYEEMTPSFFEWARSELS